MPATYDSLEQALVVGKDWSIDVAITQPVTGTHKTKPSTGLTLTSHIALTATGASALAATVAELANEPGTYRVSIDGASITTSVPTTTDATVVYCVLKSGSKVVKVWQVYYYQSDRIG